jgi:hypothetical protein
MLVKELGWSVWAIFLILYSVYLYQRLLQYIIISVTWMRGAMVARWIPVPKVACSIHVAFSHSFCLFLVKVTSKQISPLHDHKKRIFVLVLEFRLRISITFLVY